MKKITITIIMLTAMILSAETWTGYKEIISDYVVGSGDLLIIEPGTTVRFRYDSRLIIDRGRLDARGTKAEPIRFTSLEPSITGLDFWLGIEFYDSNDGKDSSYMKYCIVDNIDKTKQKAGQEGSISALRSLLSISYCEIQNNKAIRGGGFNFNSCGVHLYENNIINNEAKYEGGGIYINNNDPNELFETIIEKNLIKDNLVYLPQTVNNGGGGIAIYDPVRYANYIQISENDIINNKVMKEIEPGSGTYMLAGAGGGIQVFADASMELQIVGNKIMYNQALNAGGGWIKCTEDYVEIRKFFFKNNIISNNSGYNFGGLYFYTGNIKNPQAIEFWNNNLVHNENTGGKTGAGGLSIEHNDNLFRIVNSIFWENMKSGEPEDIGTSPYVYEGNFVTYSNSTFYIEGQSNISSPSIFNRVVEGIGATPYINYLRGNYHLSLVSPCVDKGDPEFGKEWDGTPANIGAWGLTDEATTSNIETPLYKEGMSIFVDPLKVILLDCSSARDQVIFNEINIADGGKLFINPNDNQVIKIGYLEVKGKKIGDQYTTRFEKLEVDRQEPEKYENYVLDIYQMNCTGVDFSDMSVTIASNLPSTLNDSRIYIKTNNPELTENGIIVNSEDFVIDNNVITNFDCGIYSPPLGKASKTGRITNNTVSFDSEPASKGALKKGIVVADTNVDIDNNEIINPDEGIEASQSSGRITNNTVSFDSEPASKGALKKGIYILNNSNMEVTSNLITSTDTGTTSISGIEIENSSVIASYNVIDFTEYNPDSKVYRYYGFYTNGLGSNSQFINNTINNSTYGFYNLGSADPTDFINNVVWGDDILPGYVYSDVKILRAHNNDIFGEMSGLLEDKNNFKDDPIFKSVRISDFNLDATSKCIDTGMAVKGFHVYGTNFYGDAPDVGALEYYVAVITDLDSPANVNISTSGSLATISWNAVADANSYKIYQSTDPYGSFSYVKSTSSTSWSATISTTKYFYYVIASTDAAKSNIEEPINLDKETITIVKPRKKILRKADELSNR